MANVVLFHHVQGLTDGIVDFADRLRDAGHSVACPDLFDGATFGSIEEGLSHAESIGFGAVVDAGTRAVEAMPAELVYAGFSMGAMIAHRLAQTRTGTKGGLLYHHGDVPVTTFAPTWPSGVDVQIHISEGDEFYEAEVVDEFVRTVAAAGSAELFLYPGSHHLFADSSLPSYQPESAEQVLAHTLAFLDRVG